MIRRKAKDGQTHINNLLKLMKYRDNNPFTLPDSAMPATGIAAGGIGPGGVFDGVVLLEPPDCDNAVGGTREEEMLEPCVLEGRTDCADEFEVCCTTRKEFRSLVMIPMGISNNSYGVRTLVDDGGGFCCTTTGPRTAGACGLGGVNERVETCVLEDELGGAGGEGV